MKTIVKKVSYRGITIGYISKNVYSYSKVSYTFDTTEYVSNDEIPKNLDNIEIYDGYEIPQKETLLETLQTMPIGTPLKITGSVEGMGGQQLVYCGKQYENGFLTYWFFDGKAATDDFPERFGYAEKQLFYNDVKISFNKNNKKIVDELREDFSYLLSVADSFEE